MSLELLQTIWFLLIFVLLAGYAVLDGFDLGVGILHPLAKGDTERRIGLNAIGPVWDGNEVWLLTAGGALFAAFPPVYALFGEGFYLAIMLLLTALIFRAVSMEFRSKVDSPAWCRVFDFTFFLGSFLAALLLGVALGNVLRGLPIDAEGKFVGTFLGLLNPFSLLVGVTGVVAFIMHGAAYLAVKTEGGQQARMRKLIVPSWMVFVLLAIAAHVYGWFEVPHLFEAGLGRVMPFIFAAVLLVALVYIPIASRKHKDVCTLFATGTAILAAFGAVGSAMFPVFIPSTVEGGMALTAMDHSSTKLTLTWMLGIAAIGVPMVLTYTTFIYWTFRGKTKLGEFAY